MADCKYPLLSQTPIPTEKCSSFDVEDQPRPLRQDACAFPPCPALRTGRERLTMFESFLVQVRVRGGFPAQIQVRVTSDPMSVVVGFG